MKNKNRLFTGAALILAAAGLGLNVLMVRLTDIFDIPLYLDSIGTVIVAALGGVLPGIAVGFFSNCLTSLLSVSSDPMTLYYGFLSALIAVSASIISQKGLLLKWYGRIIAVLSFSFIGGVLGSFVTWAIYGFSFGQGVSAPLAAFLFERLGLGKFFAQFTADICIDLADKTVTVAVLCLVIYLIPKAVMGSLPTGRIYVERKDPQVLRQMLKSAREHRIFRKRSIHTKITALVLCSTVILSLIALFIGVVTYREKLIEQYGEICDDVVTVMQAKINGNMIDDFLEQGEAAKGYLDTEQDLSELLKGADSIKYMYVYSIREDGCHVVFDLDTAELEGEQPGTVIAFDDSFPFLQQVLAGEEIPYFITDDTYGWLLTVYKPIGDFTGKTVAYAAADIDMAGIKTEIFAFSVSIASLLFGALIVITAFSLWYCDRKLIDPMEVLVEQARNFDYDGTNKGNRVRDKMSVNTGDELEEVFVSMCLTEDRIADHVIQFENKNMEISRMQRNIIYTLANMVESRDGNTGGHIKRTARYVWLIGRKLLAGGIHGDTVNGDYVRMLYISAPLHDIGKVKIPDAVLNKPGRLTAEEFDLMKTHTDAGRDILKTSLTDIEDENWLSMAVDMAAYHHERWDGSGYPEGLKGEQIPLCARIMAVADVFDALVSERSYKPAYSYDEAIKIIGEESGTHFDPTVVKVFVSSGREIREIMAIR